MAGRIVVDVVPAKERTERTISRSFRLSKSILNGLEEDANLQKISTNALVSKILSDYVELERFSEPFGTIRVGRDTVRDFLEMVPEEGLKKAGLKAGKGLPIAVISAKYGKINADSVLRFIREYFGYSNLVRYSEKRQNDSMTITFAHELGLKLSFFIEAYLQPSFEIANIKVKESLKSDHALMISL